MSYVDAILDRSLNKIVVVERQQTSNSENPIRNLVTYDPKFIFYYKDKLGKYTSMFGDAVSKYETNKNSKFKKKKMEYADQVIFESHINPVFRCFEENYLNKKEVPKLNIGIFDIEVDFDPERGYATTDDPFAPITAISLFDSFENTCFTLCIAPKTLSLEEARREVLDVPNTMVCSSEKEMLDIFLVLIENIDVLSGWNSTEFDIPYMVNRINRIMGHEHSARFCLQFEDALSNKKFNFPAPKIRTYEKYKRKRNTYDLFGRVHLDYLDLYRKYNTQEMHSYRLDYVGEVEVKENKVVYDGTLDQLYNNDFRKFVNYNRQDVMLLVKIDRKRKFIELSNQLAHANAVLLKTTMGSVALIEQAITNYAHENGLVVPSKKNTFFDLDDGNDDTEEVQPVVGAYVADPIVGLHDLIGCIDINSLYPSAIRALNMGPETIIGQLRPILTDNLIASRLKEGWERKEVWNGIFATLEYDAVMNATDQELILDTEDGEEIYTTGKSLRDMIFADDSNLIISANGTLFRTDKDGLIPGLLSKWYAERKVMQAKKEAYTSVIMGINFKGNFEEVINSYNSLLRNHTFSDYGEMLENMDTDMVKFVKIVSNEEVTIEEIFDAMLKYGRNLGLEFTSENKIKASKEFYPKYKLREEFWDQRQLAKKITLNATYGALLNEHCIYFDQRIGKSVTLTGRTIVRHMNSHISLVIHGEYDLDAPSKIYSDTDSSYFTIAYPGSKHDWKNMTLEHVIEYYDHVSDLVNESFPAFMNKSFNCTIENGAIIKGGRELVAIKGLFIVKKRYAVLIIDKEGKRLDVNGSPGKIKAMGLDLKRSDTPKIMQKFLEDLLLKVLTGGNASDAIVMIKKFREDFRLLLPWQKGIPKRINGITDITRRLDAYKGRDPFQYMDKVHVSGHAMAGYHWNKMLERNRDKYSLPITDGAKAIVCYLKSNPYKAKSIAYPIDQMHLPDWFKKLPFDEDVMERKIIDQKVENLIGVLKWDLRDSREDSTFNDFFSFS